MRPRLTPAYPVSEVRYAGGLARLWHSWRGRRLEARIESAQRRLPGHIQRSAAPTYRRRIW